jgi:dihydropteroate synthase
MVEEGADILDLGVESTRPGSSPVSQEEELARVVPVMEAIRREFPIPLSIDTRKSVVARASLEAGATMINDISAARDDPDMAPLAAEKGCPLILMHMQGSPQTMQIRPRYDSVVTEVLAFLEERAKQVQKAGVKKNHIILDPGIGFGKTLKDNLALIRSISLFKDLGYTLLMGLSRKSFLQGILNLPPEERLVGSLAANGWCVWQGVDILRVHDVKETVQMCRVLREIVNG